MPTRESISEAPWNFSAADYTPAQWKRSCIVDRGEGDPNTKARYAVPVRTPEGVLSRRGIYAAAGAHGLQGLNVSDAVKRTAARKLVALYRGQLKMEPPDAILSMAGMATANSRPVTGDERDVSIEIEVGDEGDDYGGCGCEVDAGEPCDGCGCTCDGLGSGTCGCQCGAESTCPLCGCSCNDPTLSAAMSGANACAPGGKKRPRSGRKGGAFTRTVAFRLDSATNDGRTLEGYAAVFDTPTRIDSAFEGTFDEQIKRGAFARSLSSRTPTLMFEHGHHPLIGSMPLGRITRAAEDDRGLYIQARLSDNWLIQPVRDAVRDGAITGMSFRFMVPEGGDTWQKRRDAVPLRTLTDVDVPELGPVVFPAYEPTTVSVRSILDRLPNVSGHPITRSGGGAEGDVRPGTRRAAQMNYEQLLLTRQWAPPRP